MLLLSFTLFACPPPAGEFVIFRHSWQCVAMFVCVSLGCWPDFPVIYMPASFLPSPPSAAPNRGVTPVCSPVRVLAGPHAEADQGGKIEVVGRRRGEEVSPLQLPQLPTVKPVTQLEMAYSVCMLEGLTSIKKGQCRSHWNNDRSQK